MGTDSRRRSRWALSRAETVAYAIVFVSTVVAVPFWPQVTIWNSGLVELTFGGIPRPDPRMDMVVQLGMVPAIVILLIYLAKHVDFDRFLRSPTAQEFVWFTGDDDSGSAEAGQEEPPSRDTSQ